MFRSIRSKLTVWYTIVLAVVLVSFSTLVYFSFVQVLRSETDGNLSAMADNFVIAANSEQFDEEPARSASENISETLEAFKFRDLQFAVFANDGKLVAKTADFNPPADLLTNPLPFADIAIRGEPHRSFQRTFRVGETGFIIFVFHSLSDRTDLENRLRTSVLVAVPIALLLAGLGGYFLIQHSFRPIQRMSERASLITSKNLHERLPISNKNDELGNLATVFNDLLDRLDKSFEQQRRFMADASHELRTPLAIVRGESEVAISKDTRSAAEYRESLAIVHDESKRLTQIVEDLFTLARADAGNFAVNFADVYLDEIAVECIRSIRTLAEKQKIEITFSAEETLVHGDESLLRRLLLNLLDNAVKYNWEGGKIVVTINDRRISVTNTGPAIPIEEQKEIFERFYRVDKSRGRQDNASFGGAGLGLAISKWIADLHKADLELSKSIDNKNTFTVIFER